MGHHGAEVGAPAQPHHVVKRDVGAGALDRGRTARERIAEVVEEERAV